MRLTYRYKHNRDYWEDRWSNVNIDSIMQNKNVYPLKYAELTVSNGRGSILEAGCGAGRILRYYKESGWNIKGIDFIDSVIQKLKKVDPELDVEKGDIMKLRFKDRSFKYVLAFGLYHNIENCIDKALNETYRVIQSNGKLCASFRADNIQTRIVDYLAACKDKKNIKYKTKQFHKLNLRKEEIQGYFHNAGFEVENIYPVENMPLLYKFKFFRNIEHKDFDENLGRRDGYKLNFMGGLIQNFLIKFFPTQFCNLYVVIARRY